MVDYCSGSTSGCCLPCPGALSQVKEEAEGGEGCVCVCVGGVAHVYLGRGMADGQRARQGQNH